MNLAIVHYHFRRGGVTRVVENAVAVLAKQGVKAVALSGEPYSGGALPAHRIVPGLGYRNHPSGDGGKALADALQEEARSHFGAPPDVWHFHNHGLGKNADLLGALHYLLARGARVLLQIHDFAEDGRPSNYARLRNSVGPEILEAGLYRIGEQIHYAVLNGRDHTILASAGIPAAQLHLLPNPVAIPEAQTSAHASAQRALPLPAHDRLFLYPTRAIRRKNVGEILLHAAVSSPGTLFATTLRPENPEWRTIHDRWEALANQLGLPVLFGVGDSMPFADLIAASDALLTTSVAEGFGLAFLEPYLFDKAVVGRDLPEITGDFTANGIALDHLYPRIPIPLEWIGSETLRQRLQEALRAIHAAYALPLPQNAVTRAYDSLVSDETVDFGRLDESLQEKALVHLLEHRKAAASILPRLEIPDVRHRIENAHRIQDVYSLSSYGKQLCGILRKTASSSTEKKPDTLPASKILASFLDPERLWLLRT